MGQEGVEVVRRWVKCLANGDLDGACALAAPDVEIIEPAGMPYGGVFRGHDGLREVERRVGATWEFHDNGGRRARWASSDDVVVRESWFVATSRTTGRPVDGRMIQMVTVRDGLIAQIVPYYWDTATYAAACSDPEPDLPEEP